MNSSGWAAVHGRFPAHVASSAMPCSASKAHLSCGHFCTPGSDFLKQSSPSIIICTSKQSIVCTCRHKPSPQPTSIFTRALAPCRGRCPTSHRQVIRKTRQLTRTNRSLSLSKPKTFLHPDPASLFHYNPRHLDQAQPSDDTSAPCRDTAAAVATLAPTTTTMMADLVATTACTFNQTSMK